jgi:hypothetical protein
VDSKWIYKVKYNEDKSFNKYKTHTVIKDNLQYKKRDYYETFSFITTLMSIYIVMVVEV